MNLHLTTLRTYAGLAMPAGVTPVGECAAIRAVRGYGRTEGKHVDSVWTPTRKGVKKAQPMSLTPSRRPGSRRSPTPRRAGATRLLCRFLDHGLRVGEVAGLAVRDFDLAAASCVSIVRRWTRSRRTGRRLIPWLRRERNGLLAPPRRRASTGTGVAGLV